MQIFFWNLPTSTQRIEVAPCAIWTPPPTGFHIPHASTILFPSPSAPSRLSVVPPPVLKMDPDKEIHREFLPMFRQYKSGRVERLQAAEILPPSLDPVTGVASKDVTIDPDNNVTARLYLPKSNSSDDNRKKLPILIYYHGGGFIVGSPFSPIYHPYLNSIVSQANLLAVSVHYRLAPEHLLPAAYDDSWAALKWTVSRLDPWIAEHGDLSRIYLAGDSAGGNIVPNITMRVGSEGLGSGITEIEGIVLFHPYFWGTEPITGETRDPERREYMEGLWKVINAPGVEVDDPRLNPTVGSEGKGRLKGLGCRRVLVCVAEKDSLAARGRKYYEDLKESGWEGEAEFHESEEEDHCFYLGNPECERALKLMEKVIEFFKKAA